MSEDLDSFFAKRKTKASKKKTAIRLDDVAQTMEYNLKFGAVSLNLKIRLHRLFSISLEFLEYHF